jgi:L-fuculose-phosphate aldolase
MTASDNDNSHSPSTSFPPPDRTGYVSRALAAFNLAFDRKLGNLAGCNMSFRAGSDSFYITRSGATKARLGKLQEDDLILADFDGNILEGRGPISTEYHCHKEILKNFPQVEMVLHTHSQFATLLAARGETIPPLIDSMLGYGDTLLVPDTHKYSTPGFVADILDIFKNNPAMKTRGGCGVLYPRHGVLVVHRSPELCLDLAERIEWNAQAVVFDRLLGPSQRPPLPDHVDRPDKPSSYYV